MNYINRKGITVAKTSSIDKARDMLRLLSKEYRNTYHISNRPCKYAAVNMNEKIILSEYSSHWAATPNHITGSKLQLTSARS